MSRISPTLAALKASGRKALTAYIVNGDPRPEVSLAAMHALVEAGVDVIELGVPFSDPMAEGPVIQKGHERALAHGTSLRSTLSLVKVFRESNAQTPVVLMGYTNPIERMGYEVFAKEAGLAGVDGVITVDLPPEEARDFDAALQANGLDNIFLIAPTSSDERIAKIAELARGFIYYVSLKGVTGASNLDTASVAEKLSRIRAHSALPVQVGFGIKDAASAKQVAALAEGVVVGSALVNIMGAHSETAVICEQLQQALRPIRAALDTL